MNHKASLELRSPLFEDIVEREGEVGVFKTFVAGSWVLTDSLAVVKSPIDGSIIAKVSRLDAGAIEKGVDVVYRLGRRRIRDIPGEKRLNILSRIADLLEKNAGDFEEVLIVNAGKTRKQAAGEVEASIDRLRKAALDLRKLQGEYVPGDWDRHTLESEGIVRREPYGVVLAIIPFNYPLFDTVNKFVYSTIPGNAFIVKPPSADPLPVIMFARLAIEAGFPPESLMVATLKGSEAERLVADRRISVISLTGSSETGVKVMQSAGIKQLIMELGGGDPAIVLADADLKSAASKIATGITSYAGQRCDAIKLVLVEEPVYSEMKKLLVEELSKVKVGDPRSESTTMGPLIDKEAVDAMVEAIEEAVSKGAKLLYGGERIGDTYITPALVEVEDKSILKELKLYKDEVFAPVALITSFSTLDEAVELANGRRYGLDAAIFGESMARIRKLIRFLEVGAIYINEYPRHGIGYYPFGGRKDSGIGREGIGYSIEYVTALKTIVYNYRGRGIWEYL
ncbi:NADP-dependent glyceraldehyde-3-phosphate dehydrogenase [Aeropyrum camini]|uniref:NADP-dependent glyceraldehyde-3-phosphate n=1 Tax=Aeropyrum camini SY1 = JCM 12091 TaxID=1198449 RepID=U3TF42_9CREN|nr:NADP-dependent glyceraldehyde-3-phosphate dehydrogenase [Aeropyrum camini]BAN90588.1 NADP-dependent glyceraldehyde-3-phosphate [Aeropyrum camini SY1 = JCM 12091]